MKDPKDRQTGDLLRPQGASRQARYRQKKEAEGYRQAALWIHAESESEGQRAALRAEPCDPLGSGAADPVSWAIGWTAERLKAK
jgi:hypothetical protein